MSYKYYFVPCCKNTSITCPTKEFINVPTGPARLMWLKATRRDLIKSPVSEKSHLYCCEDHFNLEEDLENFMKYKFFKKSGLRTCIKLKPDIIPHKFACQKGRLSGQWLARENVLEGIRKRKLIEELISSPAPSCSNMPDKSVSQAPDLVVADIEPRDEICPDPSQVDELCRLPVDKSVQVSIRTHFRSKGVQTTPSTFQQHCSVSPLKIDVADIATQVSPVKRFRLGSLEKTSSSPSLSQGGSDWTITTPSTASWASDDVSKEMDKKRARDVCLLNIQKKSNIYLGISCSMYFIVEAFSVAIKCPSWNICLALKKLKLNPPNETLADDFGISVSQVGRIFSSAIVSLAAELKSFIFFPSESEVYRLLPLPFRFRFKKVQSIIDCFEVTIEKPSQSLAQAQSWSDYYKANTVKFLISCTPHGFINFVSSGYGGRTTDSNLLEDCGYFNHLCPGQQIMADRGFKSIAPALAFYNVTLVRPPSVMSGQILPKNLARSAKQVASLRVHVERVIGRIRQFSFLSPQACTDNKLVPYLNAAVIVAAGLVNIKDPLIA